MNWRSCRQSQWTWRIRSLCVARSTSTSKCRESVSRNNPVLDQQEFGRVDQTKAAFPLREGKRRCNWLAPAKRRVTAIGGVIPRPEALKLECSAAHSSLSAVERHVASVSACRPVHSSWITAHNFSGASDYLV